MVHATKVVLTVQHQLIQAYKIILSSSMLSSEHNVSTRCSRVNRWCQRSPIRHSVTSPQSAKKPPSSSSEAVQGRFLQKMVRLPLVAEVSTSDLAAALGAASPSFFLVFLAGCSTTTRSAGVHAQPCTYHTQNVGLCDPTHAKSVQQASGRGASRGQRNGNVILSQRGRCHSALDRVHGNQAVMSGMQHD